MVQVSVVVMVEVSVVTVVNHRCLLTVTLMTDELPYIQWSRLAEGSNLKEGEGSDNTWKWRPNNSPFLKSFQRGMNTP